MTRTRTLLAGLAGLALALSVCLAAPASAQGPDDAQRAEHERVVKFWTKDKVAKAKGRDFVLDPKSKQVTPAAKPTKPGGGSTVLGAAWNGGGLVQQSTGKVLFSMGTSYYVCSASVVADAKSTRSIILTAAHCAYDETGNKFAQNWMFIPDYDSQPVNLTTSGSFCDDTKYGCWTASALVVHNGYASAPSFNDQAVLYDFAFAVVGIGGHDDTQLDAKVDGQGISFASGSLGQDTYIFGYPASGKYKGTVLVYSKGPLGTDPLNFDKTYRVASNMTGGSSGGPWFQPFASGTGTLMSVNSYGYTGITAMHGPVFNGDTKDLFDEAETASGNTLVP